MSLDKVLEAVIILENKTCGSKLRVLKKLLETADEQDFSDQELLTIFATLAMTYMSTKVFYADQLAIYAYRHFGRKYRENFKSFFTVYYIKHQCERYETTGPKKSEYHARKQLMFLKESLVLLKDDIEALKSLRIIVNNLIIKNFWNDESDLKLLAYMCEIYAACPLFVTDDHIQAMERRFIQKVASIHESECRTSEAILYFQCIGKLVKLFWNDMKRKKDIQIAALTSIGAIHKTKNSLCNHALIQIMSKIPQNCVKACIFYYIEENNEEINRMESILERLLHWMLVYGVDHGTLVAWITLLVKDLYKSKYGNIPITITENRIHILLLHLLIPQLYSNLFKVCELLLLSYRKSCTLFHDVIHMFLDMFIVLERNPCVRDEINAEADLVLLIHSLMHLHPGYDDLYAPLLKAMKDYPAPNEQELVSHVKEFTIERHIVDIKNGMNNNINNKKSIKETPSKKSEQKKKKKSYVAFMLNQIVRYKNGELQQQAVLDKAKENDFLDIASEASDDEDEEEGEYVIDESSMSKVMKKLNQYTEKQLKIQNRNEKNSDDKSDEEITIPDTMKSTNNRHQMKKFTDEYFRMVFFWQ